MFVTISNVLQTLNFKVQPLTWSKTMISSASTTVDNLCAMKTEVLCLTASLMAPRIVCKFDNKNSRRGKKDLSIRQMYIKILMYLWKKYIKCSLIWYYINFIPLPNILPNLIITKKRIKSKREGEYEHIIMEKISFKIGNISLNYKVWEKVDIFYT